MDVKSATASTTTTAATPSRDGASGYIREQMEAGKQPLLLERPNRYYVYLS